MPAGERRAGIVDAATRAFSRGTFQGTTTAEIARGADVNEALLFRHFQSKRGLYLACIEAAWAGLREECDAAIMQEPNVARHWRMLGRTFLGLAQRQPEIAQLWVQALTETTGVPEIDERLTEVMREVHAYATAVIERSAAAGGIEPGRNPRAEAWMVVAIGLLGTVGLRLGPLVQGDFEDVLAAHREWLTGSPS